MSKDYDDSLNEYDLRPMSRVKSASQCNLGCDVMNAKKHCVIHELKILPCFYNEVISGCKKFEIRKNDRSYEINDKLLLQEFDIDSKKRTGRESMFLVTSILRTFEGLKEGFVIMSIELLNTKGES